MKWVLYVVWHDIIVHPIAGLLWAFRPWVDAFGKAGDWLHYKSTEWPFGYLGKD